MFGGRRIDLHPANGIDRKRRVGGFVRPAVMAAAGALLVVMITAVAMITRMFCRRHFCGLPALELHTLGGYMIHMRTEIKTSCLKRLKRIEGQIRGLAGMVEDDRYCIDVVTQIAAAKTALRRVEEEILRDHVAHCVEHAISSGDKADQRRKIAELMDVVSRADR
jgi:DNA-binding FrmR family transcriptional regulator